LSPKVATIILKIAENFSFSSYSWSYKTDVDRDGYELESLGDILWYMLTGVNRWRDAYTKAVADGRSTSYYPFTSPNSSSWSPSHNYRLMLGQDTFPSRPFRSVVGYWNLMSDNGFWLQGVDVDSDSYKDVKELS